MPFRIALGVSIEARLRQRALKTLTDFFAPWPRLKAAPVLVFSPSSEAQAA